MPKIFVSTQLAPLFILSSIPIPALLLLLPKAANALLTLLLLFTLPKIFAPVEGNAAFPKMLLALASVDVAFENGEEAVACAPNPVNKLLLLLLLLMAFVLVNAGTGSYPGVAFWLLLLLLLLAILLIAEESTRVELNVKGFVLAALLFAGIDVDDKAEGIANGNAEDVVELVAVSAILAPNAEAKLFAAAEDAFATSVFYVLVFAV